MSLFDEHDFSPATLSPKWFAMKCRPNMLLHGRSHILSILESGVMFREDSATVEQALEAEGFPPATLFTPGEKWLGAGAVAAAVVAVPPRLGLSGRDMCLRVCLYASCMLAARFTHRALCRSQLTELLDSMVSHTLLSRKMFVCLKDYRVAGRDVGDISRQLDTASSLLCRQHGRLLTLVTRCLLALVDNVPWLRGDLYCDAVGNEEVTQANLMKVHHALLVMQSVFLRQVAISHLHQPKETKRIYKNHNERLFWLHTVLIQRLLDEYKTNQFTLEKSYRALKNYGNTEVERKGMVLNESWLYSEVHACVARANIELRVASNKCSVLDAFLDDSGTKKDNFDVDSIDKDIDSLIDAVTEVLRTLQTSQIKLRKIHARFNPAPTLEIPKNENATNIIRIEDKDPEPTDQVFYFVKTEEDERKTESADVTTAPGKKERDNTRLVLGELKRKLVKREDAMRKRERAALERTMPELKGKLPYFPRQIKITENTETCKGFIAKIRKYNKRCKLGRRMKRRIKSRKIKNKKFTLKIDSFTKIEWDILTNNCKHTTAKVNTPPDIVTLTADHRQYVITRWIEPEIPYVHVTSDEMSEIDSESCKDLTHAIEHNAKIAMINLQSRMNEPKEATIDKTERIETSSDSDLEVYRQRKNALLNDVRKHRVARKKNHPVRASGSRVTDDDLEPVEHRFGAGMALASVIHSRSRPNVGREEVFVGNGEVSDDSGHED